MLFLYFLAKLISVAITVVMYAMMVRAVMPFFIRDIEDNRFYLFVTLITEPVIVPVRLLLVKFNIGQDSPIDMAFMITYFILIFVQMFLPAI